MSFSDLQQHPLVAQRKHVSFLFDWMVNGKRSITLEASIRINKPATPDSFAHRLTGKPRKGKVTIFKGIITDLPMAQ